MFYWISTSSFKVLQVMTVHLATVVRSNSCFGILTCPHLIYHHKSNSWYSFQDRGQCMNTEKLQEF